ncbi:MAG: YdbH domain-containing protein [Opitutaceae bacterium]
MRLIPKKRRGLALAGAMALAMVGSLVAARLALTTLALSSLLQKAGASEVSFNVAQASLWHVVVENLKFRIQTQAFAARRVSVNRLHWWTPSLGAVVVEQARVPLRVDALVSPPPGEAGKPKGHAVVAPLVLPMEAITVDGQLVLQASGAADQRLTVKFEAHWVEKNTWTTALHAAGAGLVLEATGKFDTAMRRLDFVVPEFSLDLTDGQAFAQKIAPLPDGPWELAGKISGSAAGRMEGRDLTGSAKVRLRDGRVVNASKSLAMEGIEADFEMTGFGPFATKPGTLRTREVKAGRLVLRDLDCRLAFASADKVDVTKATFRTLGGTVSAEPFTYVINPLALGVVVLVEDISVAEVLALTQDLPAKATGRLDGRFPIHVDESGVQFGTGWLELKPGTYADVQFDASGLLTRGVSPNNPSYAILKKVESGLLKLQLSELRLDIRPPNAPPGRSAQLHMAGQPVDKEVRAPVTLDLNVNGPLEKLLNLGMDSRLDFGSKR